MLGQVMISSSPLSFVRKECAAWRGLFDPKRMQFYTLVLPRHILKIAHPALSGIFGPLLFLKRACRNALALL